MKLTKLGKVIFTIILMIAIVFTHKLTGILGTLAQESDLYLSLDIITIVVMFLEILAIGKIYEK
jgi:hypothetical protein